MTADVLHVDERAVLLTQHGTMNRACFEVERGRRVDFVSERIKPRRPQLGLGQLHSLHYLHEIAKHSSLRAARCLNLLFELLLVVGTALRADYHDAEFTIMIYTGNDIVLP